MREPRFLNQILASLAFIATAALAGIIGNRADRNLPELAPLFQWILSFRLFFIVLPACLIPMMLLLVHYYSAHKISSKLNQIDDRLIRLMPSLYLEEIIQAQRERSIERIVGDLQREVLSLFNSFHDSGVAIYLPAEDNPDYLVIWKHHSTPNEADSRLSFYIGYDGARNTPTGARGIAGETFLDGQTRVVHLDRNQVPDNAAYIGSPIGRVGYKSLICAAIIKETPEQRALGILCFYSRSRDTFDSQSTQRLVEGLARRFCAVLRASGELPHVGS